MRSFPHQESQIKVINQTADLLRGRGMQGMEARKKYGLGADDIILSSFGYIADTKQNHIVCQVVNELKKNYPKLRYLMVGEGSYVNEYVDGKIIMKTGFIPSEDFIGLIRASDIVANLRYPSMGETSRAVIQVLDEGKPCIVSDDAWFSELPDSVVLKIPCVNPEQHLKNALIELLEDPANAQKMGKKGQQLIEEEFAPNRIVEQIVEFLG
ncbi:MAG: glycosyltransferase family 4 protein [Bdellovibrionales bacterium]|nr:glycosyltransferase family 4 protein [Bdellovibrionales bacterium]